MPDHPIYRDLRLLDQMPYQIHAVKPGPIVVTVRINADLDVDRVVVIDSAHQRNAVLLADCPCSVCMVKCLIDRHIVYVVIDCCSQIAIIMCPEMSGRPGPAVKIVNPVDHDVLWVILTCIAIIIEISQTV